MTEFTPEELKEIVLDSYHLVTTLPSPMENKKSGKYEIKSRSKLKNLPEALREFQDPSASITHFVKNAAYFLPRAERGSGTDEGFSNLLPALIEIVSHYTAQKEKSPEHIRQKIVYLIGYLNWGSDSICNLMSVSDGSDQVLERRMRMMVSAELSLTGAEEDLENTIGSLMAWAIGQPNPGRR
jgi:hypothetical protein